MNGAKWKKAMTDSEDTIVMLPLLPLRDVVIFPHMVVPLFVGRTKSVNALSNAMNMDKRVFLATQKSAAVDSPVEKDLYNMGTIGTVLQLLRLPCQHWLECQCLLRRGPVYLWPPIFSYRLQL